MDVLTAVLTPFAALVGSYFGSRLTNAHQIRLQRRLETAECTPPGFEPLDFRNPGEEDDERPPR